MKRLALIVLVLSIACAAQTVAFPGPGRASFAVAGPTPVQIYFNNFNTGTALGAEWTKLGTNTFAFSSGALVPTGPSDGTTDVAQYSGNSLTNDQYVSVTFLSPYADYGLAASLVEAVCLRMTAGVFSGTCVRVSSGGVGIQNVTAGAWDGSTVCNAAGSSYVPTSGTPIKYTLKVVGTQYTLLRGDITSGTLVCTGSNSTYTSGRAGVAGYYENSYDGNSWPRYDDFEAGNLI